MKRTLALAVLAGAAVFAGGIAFAATQRVSVLTGLYWSLTTGTTVGTGDVAPHSPAGRLVAAAVMFTAVPLLAAVFASLTAHHHRGHLRAELAVMEERLKAHFHTSTMKGQAMVASAEGDDVSAYNQPLTVTHLTGFAFAWSKATDGPAIVDQVFAHNWQVMKQPGVHRGAYHELWSSSSSAVSAQVAHFLAVVRGQGLVPGDMLAVVASDYRGVTDAEVLEFCDAVRAAVGPQHPILVYTDLDVARTLITTSERYELWVAWPSMTAPGPVNWAPAKWKTWRFWQWGTAGTDRDGYNGTRADLDAWINSFTSGGTSMSVTGPEKWDTADWAAVVEQITKPAVRDPLAGAVLWWLGHALAGTVPADATPPWVARAAKDAADGLVKLIAGELAKLPALPAAGASQADVQAAVEGQLAKLGPALAGAFPAKP